MKNYPLLWLAFLIGVIMVSCTKTEHKDMSPQLKIIVKNHDLSIVLEATVDLYQNVDDFQQGINVIKTGITDQTGSILFSDLDEIVYYFYAEHEGKCNCYGVAATSSQIEAGYVHIVETIIE